MDVDLTMIFELFDIHVYKHDVFMDIYIYRHDVFTLILSHTLSGVWYLCSITYYL